MAKYVFPGADASMPLNWVIEQFERAGFEVESTETLGVHYSATIYRWYENWMINKDKVVEKYGVRWFRTWEVTSSNQVLFGLQHCNLPPG
jgi:sphingolipid C9-methyltransferase